MKQIKESSNEERWPRERTPVVECRKKDLIVRITNWLRDKDEPGYDVECYIGGVFDWGESENFTLSSGLTKRQARESAIKYAQKQIGKLL